MPEIRKLPLAHDDLVGIWNYIAEGSEEQADDLIDLIDGKCRRLAINPDIGRARRDLGAAVRGLPVGRTVIFYRPQPYGIEVVRVLHGARDLPTIFHDDPA